MRLLIAIIFLCSPVLADLSYGVKTKNDPSFVVRDFSDFSLRSVDMFGIQRYGTGSGELELGERPQIYAANRSGVLLGSGDLRVGLEPANGFISYRNRPDFQYSPGLSTGIKGSVGPVAFYAGPRMVYSLARIGNDVINGGVINLEVGKLSANYWIDNYYNTGVRFEQTSLSFANKYNIERQTETTQGDTYILSYRGDF